MFKSFVPFLMLLQFLFVISGELYGDCGSTDITWTGSSNTSWSTQGNWNLNEVPNTSDENAILVAGANKVQVSNVTIGCLEINGGFISNNPTITITGDYVTSKSSGATNSWNRTKFKMNGNSPQELEFNDTLGELTINNNTTVTLKGNFSIPGNEQFHIEGDSSTVVIDGTIKLPHSSYWPDDLRVSSGQSLVIESGAVLTSEADLYIEGLLKIKAGGTLQMSSGKKLTIAPGALIQLEGASGQNAILKGENGASWNFDMAGTFTGDFFEVDSVDTSGAGINFAGTIIAMDDGTFKGIESGNYAFSLNGTTVLTSTFDGLGFFDDGSGEGKSINALAYTGEVITIHNWSGLDESTDSDSVTNPKINRTVAAPTTIIVGTNNNSGNPGTTINPNSSDEFAIFTFALSQTDTATDITELTFTLNGTATTSDVSSIEIFKQADSCQIKGDQIGSAQVFTGSPGLSTFTIPSGDLSPSDTNFVCLHVKLTTSNFPTHGSTMGVSIALANHLKSSQDYTITSASGIPSSAGLSTINNNSNNTVTWDGSQSTDWGIRNNWTPNWYNPNSFNSFFVKIGTGQKILKLTGDYDTGRLEFTDNGSTNFNGAKTLSSTANISIGSGYTFTNAASGTLSFIGSANQVFEMESTWPGNVLVNNSGSSSSDTVTINSNGTIGGNLTITDGTFYIPTGVVFEVTGNVSVENGAKLTIDSGATLKLGDGSTLTVASGGKIDLVGTSSQNANIAGINTTDGIGISINGTVRAKYYSISNLSSAMLIGTTAVIDNDNYLQYGNFSNPRTSTMTFLDLDIPIPGNTIEELSFTQGDGIGITITNIDTSTIATTGPLSITTYSGSFSGQSYDNEGVYLIDWEGSVNLLEISLEESNEEFAYQGQTLQAGMFGLKQTAGSGFDDTIVTNLTLTLIGSATANDISQVRVYQDDSCSGTGGTELGRGSFSGTQAKLSLTGLSITLETDNTSPPKVCIYTEFDISPTATGSKTIGYEIASSEDIINDKMYPFDGSKSPPLSMGLATTVGSSTTWTGNISTDFSVSGNWAEGLPNSTLNCVIPFSSKSPIISSGTQACKSVIISTGTLTINSGATLEINSGLEVTGNLNNLGTLVLTDDGVTTTNHEINIPAGTLDSIVISKTTNGTVSINENSLTINSIIMSGSAGYFNIASGKTVKLPNGINLNGGTLQIDGGGKLLLGSGSSISIAGGILKLNGQAEAIPTDGYNGTFVNPKAALSTIGGSGTFSLNATSGSIYLNGFEIENLDKNGISLNGSASLIRAQGGRINNLIGNAFQFNSTGSLPSVAFEVGLNFWPNTYPESSTNYTLLSSTGCSNNTIDFSGWYGDWYEEVDTFDTSTKITSSNCNVTFGGSSSAVSISSIEAVPYNGQVAIEWTTGTELNHLGFNVYRSDTKDGNFQQINPVLILNIIDSLNHRGDYRFVDNDVENEHQYYYYVEDVEYDFVTRSLHGPVFATPLTTLEVAPATDSQVNAGDNNNDGNTSQESPSVISNTSYKDLGNGVQILSQTSGSIRIKITPAELTLSDASFDNTYKETEINGYSKTGDAGEPELLKRTILIELNPWSSEIFYDSNENLTQIDTQLSQTLISPAADWQLQEDGTLLASYTPNTTAYANTNYTKSDYIEVENEIVESAGKRYLRINVYPLRYRPSDNDLYRLDVATLDIGIDSKPWTSITPSESIAPAFYENTLKVRYNQTGVYEIKFSDLVDSFIEGPFVDIALDELRLYSFGREIPIEITDENSDGLFNGTDSIRAYLIYLKEEQVDSNEAHLATSNLLDSFDSPLRIEQIDAAPALDETSDTANYGAYQTKEYETDGLYYGSDKSMGGFDHFFFYPKAKVYTNHNSDALAQTVELNSINNSQDLPVTISLEIFSDAAGLWSYSDVKTKLRLLIEYEDNGSTVTREIGDSELSSNVYNFLSFEVSANQLPSGSFRLIPYLTTENFNESEVSFNYLNKIVIHYPVWATPDAGILTMEDISPEENYYITGALRGTTSYSLYDISSSDAFAKLTNTTKTDHTDDDGITYSNLLFKAEPGVQSIGETDYVRLDRAQKYILIEDSNFMSPTALGLSSYFPTSLLESSNAADLIIVGNATLLSFTDDLKAQRESEGLRVLQVSLEQIYAEFSDGVEKAQALKNFANYAYSTYERPAPKYMLIIGDAITDYLNINEEADVKKWAMPQQIVQGSFGDFGSDNTIVSQSQSAIPFMSIGRIPSNNPEEITQLLDKIINYSKENNIPTSGIKKIVHFADEPLNNGDNFTKKTIKLASLNELISASFTSSSISLDDYSTTSMRSKILSQFSDNSPLFINLFGHGGEYSWSDSSVIENTHVQELTNNKLPIVTSFGCYNARIDLADGSKSLADTILFQEGGAVAFIGSTDQTLPNAQEALATEFYSLIGNKTVQTYSKQTLGELFLESKIALGESEMTKDLLNSFVLLGDPSMPLPKSAFTPLSQNTSQGSVNLPTSAPLTSGGGCSLVASEGPNSKETPLEFLYGLIQLILLIGIYRKLKKTIA